MPGMMSPRTLRFLLAFGVVGALLVSIAALLFITESVVAVWARLREFHPWAMGALAAAVVPLALLSGWMVWRLLVPGGGRGRSKPAPPPTEASVTERLENAEAAGVDIAEAQRELSELRARRAAGEVYVATFGDISAGKSSVIRALLPEAGIEVGVRGGTTQAVQHYTWQSDAGDRLILADVPGTEQAGGQLDGVARAEALRAHVVIYVCDGDLTRNQFRELEVLLALNKPTVVALNKTDRYSDDDLALVLGRLRERLKSARHVTVVPMVAGGMQQVVKLLPDGREERVNRPVAPRVDALKHAVQRCIDSDRALLDQLRDSAVFVLVSHHLDEAQAAHCGVEADNVIRQYTRKAIVGALAAVTPGTDILIQGYLGMNMVKALCRCYDAQVKDVDIETFLRLAQEELGQSISLVLAIAGNAMKAFPGVGTLAGGVAHAVAYGLIFDAVGRTVKRTLAERGTIHPVFAATEFKETLSDNLGERAQRVVELALAARKDSNEQR